MDISIDVNLCSYRIVGNWHVLVWSLFLLRKTNVSLSDMLELDDIWKLCAISASFDCLLLQYSCFSGACNYWLLPEGALNV